MDLGFEQTITISPTGLSQRKRPPRGGFLSPPALRVETHSVVDSISAKWLKGSCAQIENRSNENGVY